jgi:hypothetical protein
LYGICSVPGPGREPIGQRGRCPLYYVPLWLLAVCLPVSALAIYLGLRDTGISRGLLYALTAVLSPVLLLGTAFAAVVASTALSAAFEEPAPAPQAPEPQRQAPREGSDPNGRPEATTPEATAPEATEPAASPSASPAASPSASPAASASPSADR